MNLFPTLRMSKYSNLPLIFALIMAVTNATFSFSATFGIEANRLNKIHASLQQQMKEISGNETITVFVELEDINTLNFESERVVDILRTHATESQKSLMEFLKWEKNAKVLNSFWLVNTVLVNITADTLRKITGLEMVKKIFPNFEVTIFEHVNQLNESNLALSNVTWGLDRIDAPEVWALGFNGSGIRVCVLDTGVEISHPDLQGKMWTDDLGDPTFPGGWIEFDSLGNVVTNSTPHDTYGHGTHTSGTVVGGNMSGVAIGVAPGAWLMHGLVLPGGYGTWAQTIAGMQWAIDPFDQYGNPAGERASVVSMSFGATGYYDEMITPIKNMRAAGVVPVASIGNSGEGSSGSPGNVYESFGIGAIDVYDSAAWFSSGEVVDWSASYSEPYIKPDFSAPGVDVYSSVPSSGWESWSGTSMAAPHAAGTIALMIQANPNMTVDDVYEVIKIIADDLGDVGMDIRYGWGVINASKAVSLALLNCGVEGYVKDAATLQPIDWSAQITVVGVSWGNKNTSTDGSFRIWLYPSNYSITASAFGYSEQNASVEIVEGRWTELNFSLLSLPHGFISGIVTDIQTNATITNATVMLRGAPLEPAMTNAVGNYSLEVPIGTYVVDGWAWGYKPTLTYDVEVFENQTTTIDIQLTSTIKVAILGDFREQVTNILMRNISAHERDWNVTQDIYNYDVVVVNIPSDLGEQTFLELIDAADQYQVGLIFSNTYPGPWSSYGISLLQQYLNDPKGSYYAYYNGPVYYEVTANHPIFNGKNVSDKIYIIDGGDNDFAWFYSYSGVTIADIGTDSLGPIGPGIAYTIRQNGNVHLLLSGLSQNIYTNINNAWTEDSKRLFRAAVTWASEPVSVPPPDTPTIIVSHSEGPVGTKVAVNGSGYASNSSITVKFDDTPVATSKTDAAGDFVAVFNIPLAEAGPHNIKALDDYDNLAEVTFTITSVPSELNLLAVEVNVGSIHLRGEISEFYVLTALNGVPVNVTNINAKLYEPDGTVEVLASEQKDTGFYLVKYNIPVDASNGTYTLRIDAHVNSVNGSSIGSFLVSPMLTSWNAAFVTIESNLVVIQTDLGIIKMNLTSVEAKIDAVQGDIAIIKTDVGEIKADLAYIRPIVENVNTTVISLGDGIALLQTDVGELAVNLTSTNANIAKVLEDVAIIETDVGEIKADLTYVKSVIENTNTTLIAIQGDVVTIETSIGEIQGILTAIQDDFAIVETELGQIKVALSGSVGLSNVQNTPTNGILILLFFVGIAVMAVVIGIILLSNFLAARLKSVS